MGRRSRECYLCGSKYEYCPSCSQDKNKPTWMAEFHSESCKNVFDICTRFNMKLLTKAEAKTALEKCDLSNKKSFKDYVQRDLRNIFAEEPKIKRAKKTEEKIIEKAIEIKPIIKESHEVVNKTEENK